MNEIWKEIVGFPGYYVSSLGRVKHILENGHEIILKLARNTMVQIHKRRGENLNISIGKLMYSTFNGIDRCKLDGICVRGTTLNELRIFSRNEFLEEIRTNRKKIESGDVEMLQLDAYRDMQTIISVWETGDSSVLFHRIETYKEEIISYVYHKFGIGRHEAEELWSAARSILSNGILLKERVVGTFRGFLKVTIRNIIFKQRERKKKIMSFYDNRLHGVY